MFTTERHRRRHAELDAASDPRSRTCGSASSPSRGRGRSRTSSTAGFIAGARTRSRPWPPSTPTAARTWSSSRTSSARASSPRRRRARSTPGCAGPRSASACTPRPSSPTCSTATCPRASSRGSPTSSSDTRSPIATTCSGPAATCSAPTSAGSGRCRARSWSATRSPSSRRAPAGSSRRPIRAVPERLRLLYVGRLERRKGVLDLARAISGIAGDGVRLTMVGGDTETAPLGQSMRAMLELDDRRRREGAAARPPTTGRAGGPVRDARPGRRALALGVLADGRPRGSRAQPAAARDADRGLHRDGRARPLGLAHRRRRRRSAGALDRGAGRRTRPGQGAGARRRAARGLRAAHRPRADPRDLRGPRRRGAAAGAGRAPGPRADAAGLDRGPVLPPRGLRRGDGPLGLPSRPTPAPS